MIPTLGTLVVTDKIRFAASCYTCQDIRPDEELHVREFGDAVGAIAGRSRLRRVSPMQMHLLMRALMIREKLVASFGSAKGILLCHPMSR